MIQAPEKTSEVKLIFGQPLKGHTPFEVTVNIEFFSSRIDNIRANTSEYLKVDIQKPSFMLEFPIKDADAEDIAAQLAASPELKKPVEAKQIQLYGKGGKVFILLTSDQMKKDVNQVSSHFDHIKEHAAQAKDKGLQLKLQSANSLDQITDLIQKKGPFGFLNSLQLDITFIKSHIVEMYLQAFFYKILNMGQIAKLPKSCQNFKIELKCSSSAIFDEYPNLTLPPLAQSVQDKNTFTEILTKHHVEQGKFYLFNDAFSAEALITATGLSNLLALLYK